MTNLDDEIYHKLCKTAQTRENANAQNAYNLEMKILVKNHEPEYKLLGCTVDLHKWKIAFPTSKDRTAVDRLNKKIREELSEIASQLASECVKKVNDNLQPKHGFYQAKGVSATAERPKFTETVQLP